MLAYVQKMVRCQFCVDLKRSVLLQEKRKLHMHENKAVGMQFRYKK